MISALSSKPCAISVRTDAIVLWQLMAGADAKTVVHSRTLPLFIPAAVISEFSLPLTESGKHPEVFIFCSLLIQNVTFKGEKFRWKCLGRYDWKYLINKVIVQYRHIMKETEDEMGKNSVGVKHLRFLYWNLINNKHKVVRFTEEKEETKKNTGRPWRCWRYRFYGRLLQSKQRKRYTEIDCKVLLGPCQL